MIGLLRMVLVLAVISPARHFVVNGLNLADVPCGKTTTTNEEDSSSRRQHSRILGGSPAQIFDYPYAISLKKDGQHFCGGTLIHRSFVVTAAHCVHSYTPDVWTVTVGDQNTVENSDPDQQSFQVEAVEVHPDYRFPKYLHDLAVLKLAQPVDWSARAQPMCLPEPFREPRSAEAFIAGWGLDAEKSDGGKPTEDLKVANLPLLTNQECQSWFSGQNRRIVVRDEHICAGFEAGKVDGCQGDSGGGLVSKVDNQEMELVGIMSAGIGCGRERLPGMYTRVNQYVDWIQNVLQEKSNQV